MIDNPKISVVTITYGHEFYIKQTLDGIFMQKYSGDVELILANDNSLDSTDDIIQEYFSVTIIPENFIIKYKNHEVNKGMMSNFIWALEQASGKYVALCEGDDYWTDPLKLQKQVSFLQKNPDYIIHSGKAQVLINNEFKEVIGDPKSKKTYNICDFYAKNNLITCTVMFRKITIPSTIFPGIIFGDWMLYVRLLSNKKGTLAYVADEIYSVYRIHSGGVMQTLSKKNDSDEAHLVQIYAVNKIVKGIFSTEDIAQINNYALSIFQHYFSHKNFKKCMNVFVKNYALTRNKMKFRKYFGYIRYNSFS